MKKYNYEYTMLVSPVGVSALMSVMENDKVNLVIKIRVSINTDETEKEVMQRLENTKGKIMRQEDGDSIEFIGYEDLVKIIKN